MNKIIAIINDIDEASEIQNLVDGYIMPLKDLSVNYTKLLPLKKSKKF